MSAADLIFKCRQQGIRLFTNGDKLRVVPADKLTHELKAELIQHKPEILAALADCEETDGLRPGARGRPVFEYSLANEPSPLILLGRLGDSLAEARACLRAKFSERLIEVREYKWPRPPKVLL